MTLIDIYKDAKLTDAEISGMPAYIKGEVEFYDSTAFEKLYEYFAFDGPVLMPYGTAKARDGDPDIWILEYLEGVA